MIKLILSLPFDSADVELLETTVAELRALWHDASYVGTDVALHELICEIEKLYTPGSKNL